MGACSTMACGVKSICWAIPISCLSNGLFVIAAVSAMLLLTQGHIYLCLLALLSIACVLVFYTKPTMGTPGVAPPTATVHAATEISHEFELGSPCSDASSIASSDESDFASEASYASESSVTDSPPPHYDWSLDPDNLQTTSPDPYYKQLCLLGEPSTSNTIPVLRTAANCICLPTPVIPATAAERHNKNTPARPKTPRVLLRQSLELPGALEDNVVVAKGKVAPREDEHLPALHDARVSQYALLLRRPDLLQTVVDHWQHQIVYDRILADLNRPYELAKTAQLEEEHKRQVAIEQMRSALERDRNEREFAEWLREKRRVQAEGYATVDAAERMHREMGTEMVEVGSADVDMGQGEPSASASCAQPRSVLFGDAPAMAIPQLLLNDHPLQLPTHSPAAPPAAAASQSIMPPRRWSPPHFTDAKNLPAWAQPSPPPRRPRSVPPAEPSNPPPVSAFRRAVSPPPAPLLAPKPPQAQTLPVIPQRQTHPAHPPSTSAPANDYLLDSLNLAVNNGPEPGPSQDLNTFPDVPQSAAEARKAKWAAQREERKKATDARRAERQTSVYQFKPRGRQPTEREKRSRLHDRRGYSPKRRPSTPEEPKKPLPPIIPTRQLTAADKAAVKEEALNRHRQKNTLQRWTEELAAQRKRVARMNEWIAKGRADKASELGEIDARTGIYFNEKEQVVSKEEGWEMEPHPSKAPNQPGDFTAEDLEVLGTDTEDEV